MPTQEIAYTYANHINQTFIDDDNWDAQTFTPLSTFKLYSIKIDMFRDAGLTGTITVEVSATSSGEPDESTILATSTRPHTDITTDSAGATYEFVMTTNPELTSGTKYAIIFSVPDAAGGDGQVLSRNSSGLYADGSVWRTADSGASWTETPAGDHRFEVWSTISLSDVVPSDVKYTRELVTFSTNKVFHGPTPASMTELTAASGEINTGQPLQATEAYGKVFIANGTRLRVADFVNVKINTTTLGSNVPDRTNILTGGTSAAQMAVDYIDANSGDTNLYGNLLTAATFSSGETVTGTNNAGDAVSFVLSAAQTSPPHWYNWTVYAADTATYGSLPTTADIIELHIGCVWLMGDSRYPHQWYKSRQNNPWDFLYSQNDAGSAVAGNDTDAGEVGDIIVDAISYSDDVMVVAGSGELHVISGNPAAGGRIDLLRNTGLVAAKAWTWDDEGNLYMLSTEGLLMIAKGFAEAVNLTKEVYPDFIEDLAIDPSLHRASMAYDSTNFGILITRTLVSDGTNENWWYDTRTGGLFRDVYPKEAGVFSMWRFTADDPNDSALIMGCTDGYAREFLKSAKSDDIGGSDQLIDAYITFAPIATSGTVRKAGRVSNGDLFAGGADDDAADDSDPIYVETYTSENPSDLIKKIVTGTAFRYSKTYTVSGHKKGNVDRRKIHGRWVGFKMGNKTAGESFALEKFNVEGI